MSVARRQTRPTLTPWPRDTAERYVIERHHYWQSRLTAHAADSGVILKPATATLVLAGNKWCGRYKPVEHDCVYSVSYAMLYRENFDETMAHEVVHAAQRQLLPGCTFHGEFFLYLLRTVCGFKSAGFYHGYDRKAAKQLGQLLTLMEK